ncbi:MAG: hypothetical protein KC996_06395 [Phycisphaerales bacterium]|nr:hypothetical protein [Phycisphaerales bacterium]
MNRISAIILIAGVSTAANASITDHLLYEQLTPTAQGDGASVYYSNPTHDQVMYDQFRFDGTTNIEGIGFWGAVYAETQFTISIYADNAGLPGTLAYTHNFAREDITLSVSGVVLDDEWTNVEHHAIAEFGQSFTADANTTYWLAITGDAFFSWTYGATSGDNSVLYSNTAQNSFWTNADLDRDPTNLAFSIYGTSVPAPASIPTLAMLGICVSRRRRSC